MKRLFILSVLAFLTLGSIAPAFAATIAVNTTDDELNSDGDCSLREAIQAANTNAVVDACAAGSGSDTVSLPDGTYALTLGPAGEDANAGGDLDITDSLTLEGASQDGTVIDGNNADAILHVVSAANLSLSKLTLTHGQAMNGGAVLMTVDGDVTMDEVTVDSNFSGGSPAVNLISNNINLTVSQSRFTNNTSLLASQGTALGFAASVSGAMTQTDTLFADNKGTNGAGGAFFAQSKGNVELERVIIHRNESTSGLGGGAYLVVMGDLAITDSEITENIAGTGAAGLFISCSGAVTVSSSLFQDNQNLSTIPSQGGGMVLASATATIEDTTIDDNRASTGAGMVFSGTTLTINESTISRNVTVAPLFVSGLGAGLYASGDVVLRNATFSGNTAHGSAGQGGGILLIGAGASTATNVTMADNAASTGESIAGLSGTITFTNSIIENSCFGGAPGILLSGGHNIERHNTCDFSTTTDDLIDTDPLLGPLANNGGLVETHLLLEGSPAIDAGTDSGAPATDARGFDRPKDGNGDGAAKTDIGAVEIGCGDGIVQSFAGESCDDGNLVDDDGCSATCETETGGTTGGTTTGSDTGGGTTGSSSGNGGCSLIR